MNIDVLYNPGNSVARVNLDDGESIIAEGGAMISMSEGVRIETTTRQRSGGGLKAGVRRMFSGESYFLNHFHAEQPRAEVTLGPILPGDLRLIELNDSKITVQGGSFLACVPSIDIDLNWQGMKSLFAGEGLFWVSIAGSGPALLSSFGAVYPVKVDGSYIVDTGHIVAFEQGLQFSIKKAGHSWVSSFLGGEGLVCRFEGVGTVWCQSHNAGGFGKLVGRKLRPV